MLEMGAGAQPGEDAWRRSCARSKSEGVGKGGAGTDECCTVAVGLVGACRDGREGVAG